MGDVRLIRNPFRTVLLGGKRREVDLTSLICIEESIDRLQLHFEEDQRVGDREDYQIVDFDLFQTALPSPSPLPAGERDGVRGGPVDCNEI
jgi:hypothetical protein